MARRDAGRVEKCARHRRRNQRVRRFSSAPKTLVVPRQLQRFDLGHFRHGQNLVTSPIRAGDLSRVEGQLFLKRFSQAHDNSTLHTAFELPGINDLAAIYTQRELSHLHHARGRRNRNLSDPGPISTGPDHDAYASAAQNLVLISARQPLRRNSTIPAGRFRRSLKHSDQPRMRRVRQPELNRIGLRHRRNLVHHRLENEVLLPLTRGAHDNTPQSAVA